MYGRSIQFLRDHLQLMSALSAVRLRVHVRRAEKRQVRRGEMIRLDMRPPFQGPIWLRLCGSDIQNTFHDIFRSQVYARAVQVVADCKYIFDLGANIGLAARYFAAKYPGCRILSVEPDRANFKLLKLNAAALIRNGRCRALRAAVWSGPARLGISEPLDHSGYDAIQVSANAFSNQNTVDAYSMNDLLQISGFPRIDLVKIDIEGAEVELFRGDQRWLERTGAIAIEFHGDARQQCNFAHIMKAHGFEVAQPYRQTVLAVKRAI